MERVKGRVAIVTGGANGIGRAFALALANEGARIVIADVDDKAARQIAGELEEAGRECLALHVDVSNPEETKEMARRTLDKFKRIDILVNCAAIYATLKRKPLLKIEPEEWNRVIAVNLTGTHFASRAVVPAMKRRRSGVIISMGSVNAYLAPAGRAHYNAAKAAVENLTKTMARELGRYGIRANALAPGLVRTGRAAVSKARYDRTASERALQRDLLPDDLVGPLLFLCSEDARMVTGHMLVVDGGQILR